MKKLILFPILLITISCKKESRDLVQNSGKKDSGKVEFKFISMDTIFFNYDEKLKWNDFALAYLMDKKFSKDSVCIKTFQIDFKNQQKTTFSKTLKIKTHDYEGSEWYGSLQLDSIASPLKIISYGYPACGYNQYNFLFYVNGNNSGLVHLWDSYNDSG